MANRLVESLLFTASAQFLNCSVYGLSPSLLITKSSTSVDWNIKTTTIHTSNRPTDMIAVLYQIRVISFFFLGNTKSKRNNIVEIIRGINAHTLCHA